jgi:hypothetical protein
MPLMIGATAAALQGHRVWGYLVWGLPSALIVATLWTHFRLSARPAELHVRPGQVAVRSVRDVIVDRPPDWHPLYNVQSAPSEVEVSVGWRTHICRQRDWRHYDQLRQATKQALQVQS